MTLEPDLLDRWARVVLPELVLQAIFEDPNLSQTGLARELGMHRTSLVDRLQQRVRFTAGETLYLTQRLNIPLPQRQA